MSFPEILNLNQLVEDENENSKPVGKDSSEDTTQHDQAHHTSDGQSKIYHLKLYGN